MELSLFLPEAGSDINERGIVVRADVLGQVAYIMGDAGTDAELAMISSGSVMDADILIAGHHGSRTASGALFLRAVQAETAVVSVGYNSYGQPAEETMERLKLYCPAVLRTDEEGNITIKMRADEVNDV